MDEFETLIEKYRRELMDFSRNNPCKAATEQTESEKTYEEREVVPVFADMKSNECEDECTDTDSTSEETNNYDVGLASSREFNGYTKPIIQPNENYIAPEFDTYENFIRANPERGSLRFQIFAADRAFPIQSARVTVFLELKDGTRELFDGLTDINGIIDNVTLPAPEKDASLAPSQTGVLPYSSYTAYIEHPEFVNEKIINIPVFPGIKSIQDVEMIPLVAAGRTPSQVEENEGEPFIRLKGVE